MNMEHIEELCLNYLRQASNPLVPVRVLSEYCAREEPTYALSEKELLHFLRQHGEIQVMEGPADDESIGPGMLAAAGIDMGPRAVLNTRIPSPDEMAAILAAQVKAMIDVLQPAIDVAEKEGETERAALLRQALARAEGMKGRIAQALRQAKADESTEE